MEKNCPSLERFPFHQSGIAMVRLCDVSNWSIFFRYHLVRPFDVSNRKSHLGASWYVSATSQFGQSLLGISWYVFLRSQTGHIHLGTR